MTDAKARIFNQIEEGRDFETESRPRPAKMDFLFDSAHSEDAGDGDTLVRGLQHEQGNEEDKRDVSVLMESSSLMTLKGKPIRIPQEAVSQPMLSFQPQSLPSSHGSSGSAFLSSMLNPQAPLSHTPPIASSYEVSHFGKRARAGSVSGRLRSASEYLERKGLLDRNTKGILQDLIIIGDEELQSAIDFYEAGDPSKLEEMIQSGALQNRLPNDIDILGDLDFDFLTMSDGIGADMNSNIDSLRPSTAHFTEPSNALSISDESGALHHSASRKSNMGTVTPSYDGIGDLEFAGDLMSDQSDFMQFQGYDSKQASVANSPGEASNMSEYEQRRRSNSLFSALLNDPRVSNSNTSLPAPHDTQYGKWMDRHNSNPKKAVAVAPEQDLVTSGIGASLLEADRKREEKEAKKEQKEKAKLERKEKKGREKKEIEEAEKMEHVPGSGRPRSFSDPNIQTSYDADGLQHVDRPDGWVGAYSPDSRRVRIDRFMQKRNHRVWAKTVKYDVRKNFANSRLRVKGRFVKKEDEVLMRELMSLT